jgi:ADP-dependent NAD(P)H-hydrate dehydratase / NAD(P)H-hydrate epimerase
MLDPLYTADEMRAAEARYPGYPETAPELMERAGRAVAHEVVDRYPEAGSIAVVCGGGSNGGDGRIAAESLVGLGRAAVVVEPGGEIPACDLVIDALFGTGFHGEPRAEAAAQIEAINGCGCPVVAVDVPSGVDASTGETAGAAVRADLTVTFHGPKVGLYVAPGRFHAGTVVVVDIGLEHAETEHRLVGPSVLAAVPRRSAGDNKYTAGAVLVVGGAPGTSGAVCLTAAAALRADAGYVTVCAPAEILPIVEAHLLEPVKRPLEEAFEAAERARALAVGPGLGRERKELVRRLLAEIDLPAVVDADALFELEPVERSAPTVLTPHEGELGRLIDEDSKWVAAHRLAAARRAVERFDCVVLLKGSDTIVASPGGPTLVTSLSTPSLATAGTGDVLTGIVAAFLAKDVDAPLAAAAAAVAQNLAAALGPQAGLVASDVVARLPGALDHTIGACTARS